MLQVFFIFVYMKEIAKPEDGTYAVYHLINDESSYTDYVLKLAEDIEPFSSYDADLGYYCSRVYITFLYRYFKNQVNRSILNSYENDKELKEIITTLGYDFEKFWYLLLFIYDFTYCASKRILDLEKDKFESIEDICKYICEDGAQLTLKVKGRKKVVIDNFTTLEYIQNIFKLHIDSLNGNYSRSLQPKNNNWNAVKQRSNSYHIWYFTKIFLQFFEVCPPKNIRRKKGQVISLNRKLLICKFIYLLGISKTKNFETPSESVLNAFLKQYKNEPSPKTNFDYFIFNW